MTKREFIRKNRKELDRVIRKTLGNPDLVLNDSEREMWILNDESLYNWARSKGAERWL